MAFLLLKKKTKSKSLVTLASVPSERPSLFLRFYPLSSVLDEVLPLTPTPLSRTSSNDPPTFCNRRFTKSCSFATQRGMISIWRLRRQTSREEDKIFKNKQVSCNRRLFFTFFFIFFFYFFFLFFFLQKEGHFSG